MTNYEWFKVQSPAFKVFNFQVLHPLLKFDSILEVPHPPKPNTNCPWPVTIDQ